MTRQKDYLLRPNRERKPMPRMHWRWFRRGQDLLAIIDARCGRYLPDDDSGREYLAQLVNHVIRLVPNGITAARASARLYSPWLTVAELDAMIKAGLESLDLPPISAAKLGKALRATADEVKRYGITTITAFDHGAEGVRRRQREWAERSRRAKGAQSREEYEAKSKSRTEPWRAEGISRSTWERRGKAGIVSETSNDASPSTHHRLIEPCDVDTLASRPVSPWEVRGMKKATFYRHKKAGTLPRAVERPVCPTIRASSIGLTGIDFTKFGITAMCVLRGSDAVASWRRASGAQPNSSAPGGSRYFE